VRVWVSGLALGIALAVMGLPGAIEGRLLGTGPLAADPVREAAFAGRAPRHVWDASGVLVHYPAELLAAREIRAGRLPLWNPYLGTGAPLLAEAHTAPLSPLLAPLLLSPTERTYGWCLALRTVLAAAGAFVLARRRGLSMAASALAASGYALGGTLIARFDLPTEGAAHALLPLLWLCCDAVAARRRGAIGGLALVVAATLYAAHPEVAALAVAGAVLLSAAASPPGTRGLGRIAAGVGLGVAGGAAVVLPFVAYLAGPGTTYKLDPAQAGRFASDLVYLRADPTFLRLGAPLLLLGAVAAVTPACRAHARALLAAFAAAAALMAIHLLAPAGVAYLLMPRYAVFLLVLALALAAGAGLDALCAAPPRARALALAGAAAAGAWLLLDGLTRWRMLRRADIRLGELAGALVVVGVALGARRLPRLRPTLAWLLALVTAAILVVSARRTLGDAGPRVPAPALTRALALLAPPPVRVAATGGLLAPNTATLLGVADLRARAAIFPRRYRDLLALDEGARLEPTAVTLTAAGSPVERLLGVSFVVVPTAELPAGWPISFNGGAVSIAHNPRPLPRAFAPRALLPAASPDASLVEVADLLARDRVADTAVVEAPAAALAGREGPATVRITAYRPDRVVLEVDAFSPALVVLSDTYAPGWRASVDGARAPIYPTDHLLRGVPVPAGHSVVVMTYRPLEVPVGVAIAVLALLASLGLALWPGRR
jgi:hypothetical protein